MNLSELLKSTRQYFWDSGFTEVEIPYLNSVIPNEPNIYPFSTIWTHTGALFYLPTSPEMALKKHLSTAKTNCFAISHCFRDLESTSSTHSPEFLMLEWYEVGKTYLDLMDSVKKYISQFIKIKFTHLVLPANLPDNEPDFNQFFLNHIESQLPKNKAVFVTGYPSYLSPLAKINESNDEVNRVAATNFSNRSHPNGYNEGASIEKIRLQNPISARNEREGMSPQVVSTEKINLMSRISQRFELYINGIEIANACTENTNIDQIKPYLPASILSDFANIPGCAGIGLGLNRLLSLINTI